VKVTRTTQIQNVSPGSYPKSPRTMTDEVVLILSLFLEPFIQKKLELFQVLWYMYVSLEQNLPNDLALNWLLYLGWTGVQLNKSIQNSNMFI
jgi:hypothetical protein